MIFLNIEASWFLRLFRWMNFLLLSIPKIYLQFPITMNLFYFFISCFEKGFVRCVKRLCLRKFALD